MSIPFCVLGEIHDLFGGTVRNNIRQEAHVIMSQSIPHEKSSKAPIAPPPSPRSPTIVTLNVDKFESNARKRKNADEDERVEARTVEAELAVKVINVPLFCSRSIY